MTDYAKLTELAKNIKDKKKSENAQKLLVEMQTEIVGVGDKPIRWSPRFIRLVQGSTDTSKIPDGAATGALVWGDSFSKDGYRIIPLTAYMTRSMWDPDQTKAIQLCAAPDAKWGWKYGDCNQCSFKDFDEVAKKSACNREQVVLVMAPDFSDVGQVQFRKTSYSNGTAWVSAMRSKRAFSYLYSYKLTSELSTKVKNVRLLKATDGEVVEYGPGEREFIAELFMFFHEGRQEYLRIYMENRSQHTATASLNAPEHEADDSGVSLLEPPSESAQVSDEAKKYSL